MSKVKIPICPYCYSVLLEPYENLERIANILVEDGFLSSSEVSEENEDLKQGVIDLLREQYYINAWHDDPIKTPSGAPPLVEGEERQWKGTTFIKPLHIRELQEARKFQENLLVKMQKYATSHPSRFEEEDKTEFTPLGEETKPLPLFIYPKYIKELRESTEKMATKYINPLPPPYPKEPNYEFYFNHDNNSNRYKAQSQLDFFESDLSDEVNIEKKKKFIKVSHIEDLRHQLHTGIVQQKYWGNFYMREETPYGEYPQYDLPEIEESSYLLQRWQVTLDAYSYGDWGYKIFPHSKDVTYRFGVTDGYEWIKYGSKYLDMIVQGNGYNGLKVTSLVKQKYYPEAVLPYYDEWEAKKPFITSVGMRADFSLVNAPRFKVTPATKLYLRYTFTGTPYCRPTNVWIAPNVARHYVPWIGTTASILIGFRPVVPVSPWNNGEALSYVIGDLVCPVSEAEFERYFNLPTGTDIVIIRNLYEDIMNNPDPYYGFVLKGFYNGDFNTDGLWINTLIVKVDNKISCDIYVGDEWNLSSFQNFELKEIKIFHLPEEVEE